MVTQRFENLLFTTGIKDTRSEPKECKAKNKEKKRRKREPGE